MRAKLQLWLLVLVTLCLQVPAGASLSVCLCGLESLFAKPTASCCAPVERATCCAPATQDANEPARVDNDRSCHGSDLCGCHIVRAPDRDGASSTPPACPAAEHTLATWPSASFVFTLVRAATPPDARIRISEPPGRRRNLPLLI